MAIPLRLALLLAVMAVPAEAHATYAQFMAFDPGAKPGALPPNSTKEAGVFDQAAGLLGPVIQTSFGSNTGYTGPVTIASGATLTLTGNDLQTPAQLAFGVTSFDPTPLNGFSASSASTSSPFVRLVPDVNASMTTATFTFATPIQAFGLFITGLGTAAGSLQLQIFDSNGSLVKPPFTIAGNNPATQGGAQFFGFTETGENITKVSFVMSGFTPTSRDIIGLDGIRFVPVPEPSSLVLILGGLVVLGGRILLRRSSC